MGLINNQRPMTSNEDMVLKEEDEVNLLELLYFQRLDTYSYVLTSSRGMVTYHCL